MIIGINILYLIPNQVGGTEYYARSIIDGFDKHAKDHTFVLFCNQENTKTFSHLSKKYTIVTAPIFASNRLVRVLYEQIFFPYIVKKHCCDVIYSPGYIGPALVPGVKKVVTVHDTNWKDHPEDFSFISYWATKLFTEFSMFFANTLIVSSAFAKKRLVHHFPKYRTKTKVVWPAIEEDFKNKVKNAPKPKHKNYILTVSAFYPHKKIPYLLELLDECKNDPFLKKFTLILVGSNGSDKNKVAAKIAEMRNVVYFPKVSYLDLIRYYAHAVLVIQPSIYEGFGYPVYEAVTAHKRVLVGNKKLYHKSILTNLDQLEFKINSDIKTVKKSINESKKTLSDHNSMKHFMYEKTINDLLLLFHTKSK